jgi:hypothetical protein
MRKMRDSLSSKRHLSKLRVTMVTFFGLMAMGCMAQLKVDYPKGQQTQYRLGDEVDLVLTIQVPEKTCIDGANQTKLFQSGVEIAQQTVWKELKKGVWQKSVTVKIIGNKKGSAVLTVMRKTDQQSFTEQIQFKYDQP